MEETADQDLGVAILDPDLIPRDSEVPEIGGHRALTAGQRDRSNWREVQRHAQNGSVWQIDVPDLHGQDGRTAGRKVRLVGGRETSRRDAANGSPAQRFFKRCP